MNLKLLALIFTFLFTLSCKEEKKTDIKTIEVMLSTKGNDVSFDHENIQVPAYKKFNLSFSNMARKDSGISHNVAIVKKGQEDKVMEILNDEHYDFGGEGHEDHQFKGKNIFVGISKILEPQENGLIEVPPLSPGFYTYICLIPGHGNILNMKGTLFAVASNESLQLHKSAETYKVDFFRPKEIPFPEDNSFTKLKYDLGKKLFFDPLLSSNQKISCATCHIPNKNFEDGLPRSIGIKNLPLDRSTPTVANLAWGELFFWDGRSETLEEQSLGPIKSDMEMGMSLKGLESKLNNNDNEYLAMFKKAFGSRPTIELVGKALATFERMLVSKKSAFDIWVEGDHNAISESAKRGFVLFNEKARCTECHSGWRFTDDSFHDLGMKSKDIGRGKLLPNITKMKFAFKTPTLRNVMNTAPYMHDGSMKNIDAVLTFYNKGGDIQRPSKSSQITKLELSEQDISDLKEFLTSLSSEVSTGGL